MWLPQWVTNDSLQQTPATPREAPVSNAAAKRGKRVLQLRCDRSFADQNEEMPATRLWCNKSGTNPWIYHASHQRKARKITVTSPVRIILFLHHKRHEERLSRQRIY